MSWGEEHIVDEADAETRHPDFPPTAGKDIGAQQSARSSATMADVSFAITPRRSGVQTFFAVVTVTFRPLYVFVIMELAARRILQSQRDSSDR